MEKDTAFSMSFFRLTEGWRQCTDKNKVAEAISMDLSKNSDCLPHDLFIAKLEAYGIEKQSLSLIMSHLKTICESKGLRGLLHLIKSRVPQGSILGSDLFNIFLNGIFYILEADLHNFANGYTVSSIADSLPAIVDVLTQKANRAIHWFHLNDMIINPEKFKAILRAKNRQNTSEYPIIFKGKEIKTQESVTLLGVTIDHKLSFETHISHPCQRDSAHLNGLKRLGTFVDKQIGKNMVQSLILAHFNYSPLMWYFTSSSQINKIGKIQGTALRFIADDYDSSYEKLLTEKGASTMAIKRIHSPCIEIFKSINNLNAHHIKDPFKRNIPAYSPRSASDPVSSKTQANNIWVTKHKIRRWGSVESTPWKH